MTLPTRTRVLCSVYAAIAVIALIATWSQNVAYLGGASFAAFPTDLKVNAATRSFTVDLLLLFLAAAIFMVVEGRRHGIRFVWAYIVGGAAIAISVTFPLFLLVRELRLADADAAKLSVLDTALLALMTLGTVAAVVWVDVL